MSLRLMELAFLVLRLVWLVSLLSRWHWWLAEPLWLRPGGPRAVLRPVPSIPASGLSDRLRRVVPDTTQPDANVLLAYPGLTLSSQRCGLPGRSHRGSACNISVAAI